MHFAAAGSFDNQRRHVGAVAERQLRPLRPESSAPREKAETPSTTPGMTVEPNGISIEPDAPQWQVLKLGVVTPANSSWTDPIPARVMIDETRASKVGVPLSGRVTSVLVELGQSVKMGDPLFSVASPEIAELRGQREKASVDLEAAKAYRVHWA